MLAVIITAFIIVNENREAKGKRKEFQETAWAAIESRMSPGMFKVRAEPFTPVSRPVVLVKV